MSRLWGQTLAAAFIAAIAGMLGSGLVRDLLEFIVLFLLASGLLAAMFDVDAWPDRGYAVAAIWGVAGNFVSAWIFGRNIFASTAPSNPISVEHLGNAATFGVSTAAPYASIYGSILEDLFFLAAGMIIVGVPVGLAGLAFALTRRTKAG